MLRQRVIRIAVARRTTLLIRGRGEAAERETNGLRARDVSSTVWDFLPADRCRFVFERSRAKFERPFFLRLNNLAAKHLFDVKK